MAASKVEELRLDIEELKSLAASAERQRVKDVLSLDLRKMETDLIRIQELSFKEDEKKMSCSASSSSAVSGVTKCYDVKITNYAWDQSEKFVKIFVSLKNVLNIPQDNIFCNFTSRSMILHVNGLENRNYQLPFLNLLEEIDVQRSHWKVKTDQVVVFMAKVKTGSNWSHITGAEKLLTEKKAPKMEPSDDPSASIMGLLKQMYDDGDDDMKRTIAKAWATNKDGKSTLNDMTGFKY